VSTAPASLLRVRLHFFAVYGVLGCLMPYLSIYLRDVKTLGPAQIGLVFATAQCGVLFMPAVMTLLADRYRLVAPLLVALFALNALAAGSLTLAQGFTASLVAVCFIQLCNQPQMALGDGLFFSLQRDPRMPRAAYSTVRVWGTIGFIVATLLVSGVYRWDGLRLMPWVGAAAALLGLLNALRLPRRLPDLATRATRRLPTVEAARVLLQPRLTVLCLGLGCLVATNTAYYVFYPLYLTETVGLGGQWVGPVTAAGVILEIGFMLSFERLRDRWGLGGLMLAGAASAVVRMAVLAFLPSVGFAVGLQVLHGLTIIGLLMTPAMYLNSHAPDHCRNSVQGIYVMLVVGVFSITGHALAGQVAELGLLTLYRAALGLTLLGFALVFVSLRWPRRTPPAAMAAVN
jgi:MFS transporter, PPP family, 3-phenylpropionic acid transporter